MEERAVVIAQGLALAFAGRPVWSGLSFHIVPGLSWVCGGDGRGKTSLLRVLAGQLQPTAGDLSRRVAQAHYAVPADPALDAVVAINWLAEQRAQSPAWRDDLAQDLLLALDLQPHAHKPLYMLSTGSRRKLGVLAAAASGAELTLLDMPYAALDARSRGVVDELVTDAAEDTRRAWVVADYDVPDRLAGLPLAARIDLGD